MPNFIERLQNVFTDELLAKGPYEHAYSQGLWKGEDRSNLTQQQAGRDQVASYLTEKLTDLAEHVRADFAREIVSQGQYGADVDSVYSAKIETYNQVALALHDLNNKGQLGVSQLPEILDYESVRRGAYAVADAEMDQRRAEEMESPELQERFRFDARVTDFAEAKGESEGRSEGNGEAFAPSSYPITPESLRHSISELVASSSAVSQQISQARQISSGYGVGL